MFIWTHRKQVWIFFYSPSLLDSDLLKALIIRNNNVWNTLDIFKSKMWIWVVDALVVNNLYDLIDISCHLNILS